MRVVHAICLAPEGPTTGEPYAHAWVEIDRAFVVQAGMLDGVKDFFVCRRRDFYAQLRVQVSTVYTLYEVRSRNLETLHVGPWESAYRALCSRPGERVLFRD